MESMYSHVRHFKLQARKIVTRLPGLFGVASTGQGRAEA